MCLQQFFPSSHGLSTRLILRHHRNIKNTTVPELSIEVAISDEASFFIFSALISAPQVLLCTILQIEIMDVTFSL
jgi:hypothetical protein